MKKVNKLFHVDASMIKSPLLSDFKPSDIETIHQLVLIVLRANKCYPTSYNVPTFATKHLNNSLWWFTYHDPEVRVLCRNMHGKMTVVEIRHEFKGME